MSGSRAHHADPTTRARPRYREVAAVSARGQLRNIAMLARHRRRDVVALCVLCGAAGLVLTAARGPWLLLAAVLAPLVLAVALVLAGVLVALLARTGLGRRSAHLSHTPTGRAVALTRTPRRRPDVWVVSDVLTARTPGAPTVDRTARPGYRVMTQLVTAADAQGRRLELTASHRDVAAKLYAPLGFTTDKDRSRPTMHRAPRTANPVPAAGSSLPSFDQPTPSAPAPQESP